MPSRKKIFTPAADLKTALAHLQRLASKAVKDGMARYGLPSDKAWGVSVANIQKVARIVGRSHDLAEELWQSGWYEARMLAAFVDEPEKVTVKQMDHWCRDFDNWGICDTVCFKLFDQVPCALERVIKWSKARGEFQRRGAFALLACVALHRKEIEDKVFLELLPIVEAGAADHRNFVRKGVSWALRAIATRSPELKAEVISLSERLAVSIDPAPRWIGNVVLRQVIKRK